MKLSHMKLVQKTSFMFWSCSPHGNYVFEWPYVAHKNSFAGTPVCCLQKMGSKRSSIEQLL